MLRIFLFLLSALSLTPAFADSFTEVVSKRCADTSKRISESFPISRFDISSSPTGSAEVYFGLPKALANRVKTDDFQITFNCMKSNQTGRPSRDDAMVFANMSYASHRLSSSNNSMKHTKLPEDAIEASIGELISKALAIAPVEGLALAKSCFRKALSNPTEKFRDQRTDEKTYIFKSGAAPEFECTRRERLDSGEVTFLLHFRVGWGS